MFDSLFRLFVWPCASILCPILYFDFGFDLLFRLFVQIYVSNDSILSFDLEFDYKAFSTTDFWSDPDMCLTHLGRNINHKPRPCSQSDPVAASSIVAIASALYVSFELRKASVYGATYGRKDPGCFFEVYPRTKKLVHPSIEWIFLFDSKKELKTSREKRKNSSLNLLFQWYIYLSCLHFKLFEAGCHKTRDSSRSGVPDFFLKLSNNCWPEASEPNSDYNF